MAAALRRYLELHAREEFGHDDWLRADLELLGETQNLARVPPAAVARLVGAQYYSMEHCHPVTVLGYIVVMESTAPRAGVCGWIAASAGVPYEALRTVREHADLDGGHTAAALRLLEDLPLDAARAQAVSVSGLHTAQGLIALYDHILRTAGTREEDR